MSRRPYPVAALGLLAAVDGLHAYALLVLGPDIARTLGVGLETVATIGVLSMVAISFGALPLAGLVRGGRRRAAVSVGSGLAWGGLSMLTSIVTGPWALAALATADGASTATVRTLHPSLIADTYASSTRVRALAAHRAVDLSGLVVAPAVVAALSAWGFTWRGVFLIVGGITLAAALFGARLRDPGIAEGAPASALEPTVIEWARALLRVASIRRILVAQAALGVFLAPLASYLFFYLEGRWGLDAAQRGACFAAVGLVAILAVALLAREGDRRLADGPSRLIASLWPLLPLTGAALVAVVLAPSFGVMLGALALGFACLAVVQTGTVALLVTLAPPRARSHATALAGIAVAGIGGIGGLLLLSGVQGTVGLGGAIGSLAAPALAAGLVLRSAVATAGDDLQQMRAAVADEQRSLSERPAAERALLDARGLAFAYDHRRVLDGVDLSVQRGEALAVLGPNGSGKSTLLRVLGGFSLPAAGVVRFDALDVTFLDPDRRARLGMGLLLPTRATFGSLTVLESLRVAAAHTGRAPADIDFTGTLERFPALKARLCVPAVALSEGERRMLGIAQALLVRPRLLLADEPTRGLAPAAVNGVLELLCELKTSGTAIVVVEQSLAVVEALADRACFLERGVLRFEGSPAELRRRPDLLRPIFLPPAASGATA